MTVDDIVKEIDNLLAEEPISIRDWDEGYCVALRRLREWITGDFGNVN